MDKIEFISNKEDEFNTKASVDIRINNMNLLLYEHRWQVYNYYYESYCFNQHGGLEPDKVFLPSKRFLGKEETGRLEDGLTCILGCSCGDEGCNPFYVKITVTENAVIWSDFTPGNSKEPLPGLGPFAFDKEQYILELSDE